MHEYDYLKLIIKQLSDKELLDKIQAERTEEYVVDSGVWDGFTKDYINDDDKAIANHVADYIIDARRKEQPFVEEWVHEDDRTDVFEDLLRGIVEEFLIKEALYRWSLIINK